MDENQDYVAIARQRIERAGVTDIQARMIIFMQAWIDVNAHRHPYDLDAFEREMITAFGTWQIELITRLMHQHRQRRLHRRTIGRTIGDRRYQFQIYHEKSQISDYYFVMWRAWDPRTLSGARPVSRYLPGHLTESEMRIAWPHFKRQVQLAEPVRRVPYGHAGETWDFHEAWDRALNAARFFAGS